MTYIDVSLAIHKGLIVWPGDPPVKLDWQARIGAESHSNITTLNICAHTGTHVDAPFHFLPHGKTVDTLELEKMIGKVRIIDIPDSIQVLSGPYFASLDFPQSKRILFKTRNSSFWAQNTKKFMQNYVALDSSGATWLVEHGIEVVGIDYLSIATFEATQEPHEILLGAGLIVIEGLDLSNVNAGEYKLICLPINLVGRDGAPARVILETLP